ncbi:protein-glutamate O-methyltransferase CheR [Sphingomonas sp. NFR15]|uniref:CheR family methyltransferase n=1 Tax=Sphingomonas sp. NFR15 TaxID=1566282 RepID=UPI00088FB160|nr:protein-glutamate O-methyltransferase CheR [Sphingomonas sp. NFR15]SDA31680.1 chemotaxis protein methyltransferase CheR [Sphingomonas sp. NFR15]
MNDAPVPLAGADLAHTSALIHRWTGMTFGETKRYYIERRLAERMKRTGHDTARVYLAFAAADPGEREALINAFTINETYFYREEHHFAALARQILPAVVADRRPGDRIRIWSMPCSTGEEAYSIAIWLLENWRLVDAYNIEIVGSDIDTHALARAREGRYAPRALARLPAPLIATYFEAEHRHTRRIIADLRESVHFTVANLVDRATLVDQGMFDVILCRNLLIYFDDAMRAIAADNLFERLNPGGYLALGHSESMARISDRFTTTRLDDAIVYRRP